MTSRGIVLDQRACWVVLAFAMTASAALLLYLSRGTTFAIDEVLWIHASPGTGIGHAFEPYNGALIATNRILYRVILETIGPDYVVFRVLWIASVLGSAGLLYAVIKRWVGPLVALAPAIVLLFFGSSNEYFTSAIGFIALFSIATGLGALLAVDRDDTIGDLACCALLILSIATFSTGLGFLAGVAISVLLRGDRISRAWIVLVPLLLYAAWWLWARSDPDTSASLVEPTDILLWPSYVAESLAASLAALVGLNYDFAGTSFVGANTQWGYPLAAIAVAALVLRLRRGAVPTSAWVSIGIVLTVWTAGTLVVGTGRIPQSPRYMYVGAVGVILVAAAAATHVRFTRVGLIAIFAVAACGLATNLALLRERASEFRDSYSASALAGFTALELARDEVQPSYIPPVVLFQFFSEYFSPDGGLAAGYLRAADRYGSLGIPFEELPSQTLAVRNVTDRALVEAKGIDLEAARGAKPPRRCRTYPAGTETIELPRGGAYLRSSGSAAVSIQIGRFAEPSLSLGRLNPGVPATVSIKPDASPVPWAIVITGNARVEVCASS